MEIDRINAVAEQQWLSILFKKKYITEDINGQVNLKSMIDFLQYE